MQFTFRKKSILLDPSDVQSYLVVYQQAYMDLMIPHVNTQHCPSSVTMADSHMFIFFLFIWFVRLLALQPLLAYCASPG
jgi:hypothetical protein